MEKFTYETIADRIKLLAHPERLRILDVLRRETECVCHLEALLGKPQPYVSQQLRVLREAGLIQNEQIGHNVYYRLADREVAGWLAQILGPADGDHPEIMPYKRAISCDCPKCGEKDDRGERGTSAEPAGIKKVLILCTGNSCRSQMAEGLINARLTGFEAYSAGPRPTGYVHPKVIEVMNELGIDLSSNQTKHLDRFHGQRFDYVITVCNSARENCPVWLGEAGRRVHLGFDDPAEATGSDEEITAEFRRVRDEIAARLLGFLEQEPA
jgi:arsenate reductase